MQADRGRAAGPDGPDDGQARSEQPRPVALHVDIRRADDDVVTLAVIGEIDMATAPLLWDAITQAIPACRQRLVVDLSDTTFMDSTALAVLVRAREELRRRESDLVLRAPSRTARRVLATTGLDQLFTVDDGHGALITRTA